jgi:putative heme-binding domain-containing protein
MRLSLLCTFLLLSFLALLPSGAQSDPPVIAEAGPKTPAEERQALELPPGFDLELVASEPDIHKPLNLSFDNKGRLWVTDTVEYPYPAKPGAKTRDTIKILDDFGPDGRARKITTFGRDLNIPIGNLPLHDGALVFSIPSVWRLHDQGDGSAGKPELLLDRFGVDDTHGMTNAFTWGFDGWVYACHGYRNTSTVKALDGSSITMNSGNVYRFKPDGSHIEQVTWGQVNPFGLCFDALGNLYSADCHSRPLYQLLWGSYYPSFEKGHDGLGFGPEMLTHDHGGTGFAGVACYAADHFPKEYQNTFFIGNVITCRVNHDATKWSGSSPRALLKDDFIKSKDTWFRPVDIKLGPDGALYIADFYNCIIGHYEVPLDHPKRDRERGRIWRVVYRGPDGKGKPQSPRKDWTKADLAELTSDLGHANLTVRTIASNELTERARKDREGVVKAVAGVRHGTLWQRVHALWVLERCAALTEEQLLDAVRDSDAPVRVHVQRILAERKELPAKLRDTVVAALKDGDALVSRCATEALGRHPNAENIPLLIERIRTAPKADTHLIHVARMALRDTLRPAASWKSLAGESKNAEPIIASVALGVPSPESANWLLEHLDTLSPARQQFADIARHIARQGNAEASDKLVAFLVKRTDTLDLETQSLVFTALEQGTQARGGSLPESARQWATPLTGRLLASTKPNDLLNGIKMAGTLKLADTQPRLVELAGYPTNPEPNRLAACNSLVAIDAQKHTVLLGAIIGESKEPMNLRRQVTQILARLNHAEARAQLLAALPTAPAVLQTDIAAGLAGTKEGAEKLLETVASGKASARLLLERAVDLRLKESKLPGLGERVASLTRGLPPAEQRINDLINQRREGYLKEPRRADLGKQIFAKHCANCHQIANEGAKIGPQLDGIGIRGLERLLEDTLDPNRNVDQAFRTTVLNLKNGQVVSGLFLKEEGEVLVLADNMGKEVRVPKKTVDERTTSQLSPMPADFEKAMPEADFYNLLAYLLAQIPRK